MSNFNEIRILLSMPSFGHPKYKTLKSIVEYTANHKYKTLFHFIENTVIHRARNVAIYNAVDMKCTHLLFIDDDMIWEPGMVEKLIEEDKDVIGALCFARSITHDYPPKPVIKNLENGVLRDMDIFDVPAWDKPFEVSTTGTAFLLINMNVFKKIDPPFFYFANPEEFGLEKLPFPEDDISEDTSFMLKLHKAGIKVWVDPTVIVGHIGEKTYKRDDSFFSKDINKNIKVKEKTAIFIPTVDRVENIKRLVPNIREATPEPHEIYVMTKNKEIIEFCKKERIKYFEDEGSDIRYATRMNFMYKKTSEPYIFTASDDILFHKGWLSKAIAVIEEKGGVVAVNDTFNPLGTNFLIEREYIKNSSGVLDIPDVIFYPGYQHSFCDTELISVAKIRGKYSKCQDSIVEHKHWRNQKGKYDKTYKWADERLEQDQGLFLSRKQKFKFPSL